MTNDSFSRTGAMSARDRDAQPRQEDLIFDVGMHIGQDTEFYLRKGFRVVAVEANPSLCEQARIHFREQIESGRLTVVSAAITAQSGPVKFYANENPEWGTIEADWAARNVERFNSPLTDVEEVEGITFDALIESHGIPHFLKVDIEGSDTLCLKALRRFPVKPAHVSIESDKRSWKALVRELDLFEELGYRRFKVVNQRRVRRQVPPRPPREGVYVATTFQPGASGLFGEEAPGRWLTRKQCLMRYAGIFLRYRIYGEYGFFNRKSRIGLFLARSCSAVFGRPSWYDTHAAL
jgi:FkbM family methyltransferase